MSEQLHSVDVLFGIYRDSLQREESLIGLHVYTQTFRSGFYLASCQLLNQWVKEQAHTSGCLAHEFARGPAGCFDIFFADYTQLFEAGDSLVFPARDYTGDLDQWVAPTECNRVVDSRGKLISNLDLKALIEWQ